MSYTSNTLYRNWNTNHIKMFQTIIIQILSYKIVENSDQYWRTHITTCAFSLLYFRHGQLWTTLVGGLPHGRAFPYNTTRAQCKQTGSTRLLSWSGLGWCAAQMDHFLPQSPGIWVHFLRNVLRKWSYILPSTLRVGFKQRIFSNFGNWRCLIRVIGCRYEVMRLSPGDYSHGWGEWVTGGFFVSLKNGCILVFTNIKTLWKFGRVISTHPHPGYLNQSWPSYMHHEARTIIILLWM